MTKNYKSLIILILFALQVVSSWAQKPFVFHNKKFRTAQFTDLHWDAKSPKCDSTRTTILNILQREKPDIAILTGDVVTEKPYEKGWKQIIEIFETARTPFVVTMGNHDRDALEIVNEVKKTGIIPLFDESITLNNDITLVGRKDKSVSRDRLDTAELLNSVDLNKTIILVDHQPDAIDYHATLPIDVQLSGHTHRGQLWPLNFITDVVYTLDHGYAKINGKHFFTSAGYGFWGPPFKTSARSEVWMITIEGK